VEIRISDNGKGIAPEHIRRIFDPFFTTKMGRGGSGLGLNIVHNLVRDVMGGSIRVESEPGHGTVFVITLPRHAPLGASVRASIAAD
jgi:signal transduction histidine kinase